jgi:hypothetical protein
MELGVLTPATFWSAYRTALAARGSWDAYQSNKRWTEVATAAAEDGCAALGLTTSREKAFRIDVVGWSDHDPDSLHDGTMRVAFEVESGAVWRQEVCKLCHFAADLRVIVAYEWHATWKAVEALEYYLEELRVRMFRMPTPWLFVFGPSWERPQDAFEAFEVHAPGKVTRIADATPLRGWDLAGPI